MVNRRILSLLIIVLMVASGLTIYFVFQAKDRKPPVIKDLKWEPTRTVYDKVYDGKVSFVAEDEDSHFNLFGLDLSLNKPQIANVTLAFVPKVYNLPKEAFPNETARVLNLVPVDGKFDSPREEFSVDVKNITGGREYVINAFAKDAAGNISNATLTTPYIRELENLGRQLYDKGMKVGIIYGLITSHFEWDSPLELGLPYKPLLGYYVLNSTKNDDNLMVITKHMDWLSGHGVNFVLDLWDGKESEGNFRDIVYRDILTKLDIFKTVGMRFGILYESHWRFIDKEGTGMNMSDPRNIQILKEDLSYITENYFKHPAYLKINEKPFFYIWGNKGMYGDVIGGLKEVYKFMKENYGTQLYMVNEYSTGPEVDENWGGAGIGTGPPIKDLAPLYNAMLTGAWVFPPKQWGSWEGYLEKGFEYWYNFSLRNGLDYIPFVIPGASAKYTPWAPPEIRESDPYGFPRSIDLWKKRITLSIPYSSTFGIMVGDFNNVFENAHLEPTVQEGFEYLEALKDVLTAPTIDNLSWSPLDVRNDKVYSLKVDFKAEDIAIGSESPGISNAVLEFIPVEYINLPKEAFPEDNARKYELIPLDGLYGNVTEKFAVNITNITGGREYEIRISVTDNEGNERTSSFSTPYIREFENLGRQLYDKGVKVGIIYGLIPNAWQWNPFLELGGYYKPLLGYYNTNSTKDLIITEKHMDWMSGHGINFILDIWSGRDVRDDFFKEAVSKLDIFKTGGMKFAISYESHWRFIGNPDLGINMTDPRNIQILEEDLSYLKENYFDHPAYLKIDGKPFFYIYGNKGMYGNVIDGLEEVHKFMKENHNIQLYMASDLGQPGIDENWGNSGGEATATPMRELTPFFDAMITGLWLFPYSEQYGTYENFLKTGFDYWYSWSIDHKLDYIPSITPGFSNNYTPWQPPEWRESDLVNVPRSVELWEKRLVMSISYSNTFGIMVGDFNNIMENGHIEPTFQEGFEYLKAMKEVLTEYFIG